MGVVAEASVESGEKAWDTRACDKGSNKAVLPSRAANFREMLWYTCGGSSFEDSGGKRMQRAATTSHTMAVRIRATIRASDSGEFFVSRPFSCNATILVPSVNSLPKIHFFVKDQKAVQWFRW